LPTGRQSGYGEQAVVLLRSLATHGKLNVSALEDEMYAHFGPGSEYFKGMAATGEYHVDGTPSGKTLRYEPSKNWPIQGPWMHHSVSDFLTNMAEGKESPLGSSDDKQIDGAGKVASVVARYYGRPELLTRVEASIRVV